jgi:magnesium and cobalt transporter
MAKDLLPFMRHTQEKFCIKNILRPAIVVPESKYVNHMLKEFRLKRYHMAIVIDEFGAVSGLITIEDILELIVGKIEDEYDNKENLNIRQLSQNTFTIKSLTHIKEFNETFNTDFKNQEVDTVGGLVMQECGHLPRRGDVVNIKGYKFKIHTADSRRIIQIHVSLPDKIDP